MAGFKEGWQYQLERQFDCQALAAGAATLRQHRRRRKRRAKVMRTAAKFRAVMSGDNPPQTREQAVRAVVGSTILVWIFQALAAQVVEWLWDRWFESDG